jgi:hypothetical protein
MATRAIPFQKVTVVEVARVDNQTLVKFSDGKITVLDTDGYTPHPGSFASDLLMKDAVTIVGSRMTDDGLLIRFSDGQFHLFQSSFMIEHRDSHADRIRPGQWLVNNWKRNSAKN